MKKHLKAITSLIIIFILAAVFGGCSDFTPPPSKEADNAVKIFSNSKLNGINLVPVSLFIKKDYSGYIIYQTQGKVDDVKNSIINTIETVNQDAFDEGNFQAGYRVLYVQEKNITQKDDTLVSVIVGFRNINHLKGDEVKIQTIAEYLDEHQSDDNNFKFVDVHTNSRSSIALIEDKENNFIAVCKGITNQAEITMDGNTIIAYYIENEGDMVTINKNRIFSSTGNYKFVFTEAGMPLWLIIVTISAGILFIIVLCMKIIKELRRRNNA